MKIGIIGFGFVGKALANALHANVEVFKVDPKLQSTIKDLSSFKPDIVFICLPSPMMNNGDQDASIILKAAQEIMKYKVSGLIVLKSTVHPDNIKKIQNILPNIVYNPEFLREKHANEDFINSSLIVFGGKKDLSQNLANFYKDYTKCLCNDYVFTDSSTASLLKYTINSFLATKVIFFNEICQLFNKINKGESWTNFISFLSKDSRLGESHMMVPGHDQRYGFGGACLPKDSLALVKYSDSKDIDLKTIKNTININNKLREKYNKLTDREEEQNIKYNNKQ